jgi:hypothetical protein
MNPIKSYTTNLTKDIQIVISLIKNKVKRKAKVCKPTPTTKPNQANRLVNTPLESLKILNENVQPSYVLPPKIEATQPSLSACMVAFIPKPEPIIQINEMFPNNRTNIVQEANKLLPADNIDSTRTTAEHKKLCDEALKHFTAISKNSCNAYCEICPVIIQAIVYYKEHYKTI